MQTAKDTIIESLVLRNNELSEMLDAQREANKVLLSTIEELQKSVTTLTAQVAELTARLSLNSSNSSKPPSSDGLGKPSKQRSLRSATGRKPGGQAGHPGATLAMVTDPDVVIDHRPDTCADCGHRFGQRLPSVSVEARQVADLPATALEFTEHRLHAITCPKCFAVTKAAAPKEAIRQIQYGPNMAAFCVNLTSYHNLPYLKASELVADLFDYQISPATIETMVKTAAGRVTQEFKPVAASIIETGRYAHADETGFRVAGKTRWVHSISNPVATWIQVHDRRGSIATDDIGILPKFGGTLIHDAWGAYDKYSQIESHQLCNAHLLRELNAIEDNHRHDASQWCWASQVKTGFAAIIADPATAETQRRYITSALSLAARDDPAPAGRLGSKEAALIRRINTRLDDYLKFTTIPGLPATNNPAEQEIRMIKVKQKIAGSMRTITGATNFTAIRSYLSTARKNGQKALAVLSTLFEEQIWLPKII